MKISNYKLADYVITALTVFLLFCLIFEQYLVLPTIVAWLGRWHPLVLHFPVVLILVCVYLSFFEKKVPKLLLLATTITALVTAISGFFLGTESNPKGTLLFWHQWLGAATAFSLVIWYWLDAAALSQKVYTKIVQGCLVALIGSTGHFGGMVTHGENFLNLPTSKEITEIAADANVYETIIQPIFEEKCVKCHNPNKPKGELIMTNFANLLKGGKHGHTLIPSKSEASLVVTRLHLPIANEEHMPPKGETPLTEDELKLIERWIDLGASDTLKLNQLKADDALVSILNKRKLKEKSPNWEHLPKLDESVLTTLNESYYMSIQKIIGAKNALSVTIAKPPTYNSQLIFSLKPIAENIVELDVSGLPLSDEEIDFITTLKNLERLELDKSPITDNHLKKLTKLTKIRALKVYSTSLTDASSNEFKKWKNLRILHLWNTKISINGYQKIKLASPQITINKGYETEILEFFKSKQEKVSQQKLDSIAKRLDSIISTFEKPILTK